jgi:amyloid beta precursor protein binding protein 1
LLCAPTPSKIRKAISEYAEDNSIPLIYIHCAGFYSYFSIQLPSTFPIADTHPDPDSTQDLRLLAPWQELSEEVGKLGNLKGMDDYEHGHIPYLYLLLHYLEEWKTTHSGNLPSTFKEKIQFRDLVREGARTKNSDGGEENFDEACAAVLKGISPPFVGSGLKEIFAMPACIGLTANSPNFWIIANAIKAFYKQHSVLPLPGSLPDMKARSADYIALQNVYKSKARADVSEVLQTVRATEKSLDRQIAVPESEVEQFCKNAAHVKVLAGQPLIHTRLAQPEVLKALEASLTDPSALEPHLTPIFMSLVQTDEIDQSTKIALNTLANGNELKEAQRAKSAELHNIASLTGGQVAQEAIKIITRQYVPVDNLGIFDGINNSRSEVLKF